ncbi:MJ0042 family finger-like domain-containing protein [Palleronia pelagia]|uniref:MJ0042 family finger-like domain-containing protein n=2 Tax=Palleronia pelagia TaxID=387096 RepID=A0A1H8FRX8_9RHOB|nr:MJ0042 family finger-like domain-containing protein [Palleronia pelagia]
MRLICPNCEAQYEIDPGLIPSEGRDVQCSNCGNTWFAGPDGVARDPADAATPSDDAMPPEDGTEQRRRRRELDERTRAILREEAEREAAQRRRAAAQPVEEQTEMGLPEPARRGGAAAPPPAPDPVETEDYDDEADWGEPAATAPVDLPDETAPADGDTAWGPDDRDPAGQADAGAPDADDKDDDDAYLEDWDTGPDREETQPHDPVAADIAATLEDDRATRNDSIDEMDDPAPTRRQEAPDTHDRARTAAASRGDLLPDIDQINSTLTATSRQQSDSFDDDFDDENDRQTARSGSAFRLGFGIVLFLTALAMLLYYLAPQIVQALPRTELFLAAYVQSVNEFRAALDNLLISAAEMIVGAGSD